MDLALNNLQRLICHKTQTNIARDMGVFKFLIRQVVHEDIHYFSWERADFYHRPLWTRGKMTLHCFSKNQSILSNQTTQGFSQIKKISIRTRCWTTISLLRFHKMYQYWWKQNIQFTSWCLGWYYASIQLPTWPQTPHQVPGGDSAALDWESGCWKTRLATGLCTMSYKQQNPILAVRKFLQIPHIWLPNSPDCNPLDYYLWVWLSKRPTKP